MYNYYKAEMEKRDMLAKREQALATQNPTETGGKIGGINEHTIETRSESGVIDTPNNFGQPNPDDDWKSSIIKQFMSLNKI